MSCATYPPWCCTFVYAKTQKRADTALYLYSQNCAFAHSSQWKQERIYLLVLISHEIAFSHGHAFRTWYTLTCFRNPYVIIWHYSHYYSILLLTTHSTLHNLCSWRRAIKRPKRQFHTKYTIFLQAGWQLWYTINCISLCWSQRTNEIEQQKSADDLRAPPRKLVSGLCVSFMGRSGQVSKEVNGVAVSQQVTVVQQAVTLPAISYP
jgi:hypothetical protein